MLKKSFSILCLVSFVIYTGCASIHSQIPVKYLEKQNLSGVDRAMVVLKDGGTYEFREFELTESDFIGKQLLFLPDGWREIRIPLAGIEYIVVDGARDIHGAPIPESQLENYDNSLNRVLLSTVGLLAGGALGFLVGWPLYWMDTSAPFGAIAFFGGMISGGYVGYQNGAKMDKQSAVEKIYAEQMESVRNSE